MLAQWDGRARLIAGGTDLVLEFNEGKREADCLVDITRIPELKGITLEGDTITVGAAVTFRQLDDSPLIRQRATVLAEAAHAVGSLQIRNVATLDGNVVSALPAADGILGLNALDAEVELADSRGRRWVPLEELFGGPGQSKIDATAQVLTALRFKALGSREGSAYERLARRRALALPILACGVAVGLSEDGSTFQWARISLGPVAPVPFRACRTEEFLAGTEVSPETMVRAGEIALSESHPRTSLLRASKEYRLVTVEGLAKDGELDPLQQAFIDKGAVQCGYCTPGLLMSARALLEENPHPSEQGIKDAIAGNLCRCTGYLKIVEAIKEVAR